MQLAVFCTCYCYTFKLHTHMNLYITYYVALTYMISTLEKIFTFSSSFNFISNFSFCFFLFFFFVWHQQQARCVTDKRHFLFVSSLFYFFFPFFLSLFFPFFFCVNVGLTSGRPILSLSTATTRDLHTHHLLLNTHEPRCLRTLLFYQISQQTFQRHRNTDKMRQYSIPYHFLNFTRNTVSIESFPTREHYLLACDRVLSLTYSG